MFKLLSKSRLKLIPKFNLKLSLTLSLKLSTKIFNQIVVKFSQKSYWYPPNCYYDSTKIVHKIDLNISSIYTFCNKNEKWMFTNYFYEILIFLLTAFFLNFLKNISGHYEFLDQWGEENKKFYCCTAMIRRKQLRFKTSASLVKKLWI